MSIKVRAVYDGKALQLKEPLDLPADTEVEVTVSRPSSEDDSRPSFLRVAREANLKGPRDWSSRIDEYLYGSAEFEPEPDPD